jgi:hypothetical protein
MYPISCFGHLAAFLSASWLKKKLSVKYTVCITNFVNLEACGNNLNERAPVRHKGSMHFLAFNKMNIIYSIIISNIQYPIKYPKSYRISNIIPVNEYWTSLQLWKIPLATSTGPWFTRCQHCTFFWSSSGAVPRCGSGPCRVLKVPALCSPCTDLKLKDIIFIIFFQFTGKSLNVIYYTVKGARGKVSFDSLNVKCASKLSCYASPQAYLSHLTSKITNTLLIFLSDKYASWEASLDSCEAYLSVCETNDTLPRAPFTVYSMVTTRSRLHWCLWCECGNMANKS